MMNTEIPRLNFLIHALLNLSPSSRICDNLVEWGPVEPMIPNRPAVKPLSRLLELITSSLVIWGPRD